MENFIKIVEIVLSWQVIFGIMTTYILMLYKTEIKDYLKFKAVLASGVRPVRNSSNRVTESEGLSLIAIKDTETAKNIYMRYPFIETNRNLNLKPQKNHDFEDLWFNTYGSQIELLEDLKMKKQENLYNLVNFYERFLNRMPESLKKSVGIRYSFKFYLKYLILNNLIRVETQHPNEPTAQITDLGKMFLSYVSSQHPKSVRPL